MRTAPSQMRIHFQRGADDRSHSRSSNNTKRDKSHRRPARPGRENVAESGRHITDRRRGEYAANKSSDQQTGDVSARCAADTEKAVHEDSGEHGPFAAVRFTYGRPEHGSEGPT